MKGTTKDRVASLSAGTCQGVTPAALGLIVAIQTTRGLGSLSSAPAIGLWSPVAVSLLFAIFGDRLGGRTILLWSAGLTAIGAAGLFSGGLLAEFGDQPAGRTVAWGGALLFTGIRLGELLVIARWRGRSRRDLYRGASGQRRWVVVGYYAYNIPSLAIVAGDPARWPWVFGMYAAILPLCLVALWKCVPASEELDVSAHPGRAERPQGPRRLRPWPADRGLQYAVVASFFARATPVAFNAGLAYALTRLDEGRDLAPLVLACSLVAAWPVGWRPFRSDRAFAACAGVAPILAVGILATSLLVPEPTPDLLTIRIAIFGLAAIVFEIGRQWSTIPVQMAAGTGTATTQTAYYRDQGIQQTSGGVGQVLAGALLGALAARHGLAPWLWLILADALCAWTAVLLWIRAGMPARR